MPRSKPRRQAGHGEIIPPLSKLDRIEELLKIQLETFPQKELTPEEINRWGEDLSGYPLEAIEYAFESHRQLAMFFPVPVQILEICKTWERPAEYSVGCSSECKSRHDKGYRESDVLYLWKLYQQKKATLPNRSLTDGEVNVLLDELDRKRGCAPEWRQA